MKVNAGQRVFNGFSTLLLILSTLFFIFPFYWIVTGAFKFQTVATQIPPEWFPLKPTLQNWVDLFKNPVWRWTLNSFIIALVEMFAVCLVSASAGYVLAKKLFPGRKIIFTMFIAAMALPKQVILVPLFTMLADFGWVNTYHGLILPAIGWPFGVFLMKQFAQTVPGELIEAAKIDGCSEIRLFSTIILPLLKPALGALAIFTFIASWNDYFSQLIMTRSTSMMTLPLGVATMQGEFTTNYGIMMAGAALASVPMITIFLVFQKAFTQGITMGAVKG
ncbi:L-arabinose transport system permease protein AraQ [Paenibacillus allorhizoplanae]|uniref:L-arabinose transport system permease protein AraQ n=1 Tax=Paenibacillus allorhizoplanae TaxID=2905648 RepID=A0ABN8H3Y7_9BACL|nr:MULTISPECIES: carbohydrate ABC transporter permease [Paenibacillus]KRE71367.1 sugar ABC transporter permease [Paenibacillus sp. Soil750]CAH1220433.1 L-arabinose transport system permease protein AraQ [Paenibacillus allorhizoplanae]